MDQQNQLQSNVSIQEYVPSSVEKKKALMMYFLFGIIIVISNKKVNDFEFFHVKQAMWWWMIFILSILISAIVLFIPIIKFLGIIWLLAVMIVFVIVAKQAWDGKYYQDVTKYSLGLFPSLWAWLFGLFGITFDGSDLTENKIGSIEKPINQIPNTQMPSNIDQTPNTNTPSDTDQISNIDQNNKDA